ncbi:LpqB family beta-propeller domain-containing protein [Aeromicrobium sp. UC242_57]|uniref:LpqB family beta-propeller domain-containing protein n=1 Tax=Aeromicrobium sp. UC242_57 TaxID=3374624 RepID=UPI00379BCE44
MRTRTTRRLGTLAVLVVVAVSACAGIPSSGPVTKVADDTGLGESTVRYSPAGPIENGTPEQIVRGFLDAMLAYPTATRTAAAFLTPKSADGWNPASGMRIYSKPKVDGRVPSSKGLEDPQARGSAGVDVRLSYVLDAELDGQGHYTHRGDGAAVTFTLQRAEGQWRIVDPPDGLMVNAKFFSDYLRPFNLYFFDRPGRRLVPDPVHIVVGDQLATSLITSLVRGQPKSLEAASRTYVPPLDVLRPAVTISRDGVAEVEFTSDLSDMAENARDRMSAQIVWTLRQVPTIESVQIIGDTSTLLGGRLENQPISSWGGFGPSISRGRAHAVVDDRVVTIDGGEVTPVKGSWGKNARGAVVAAVSSDGVAGVLPGRSEVRVTQPDGSDANIVTGSDFLTPQWDSDGLLWLVDTAGSQTRIRVRDGDRLRSIDVGRLAARDVRRFALSPDGTRYAVETRRGQDREVRVGTVLRDAKDRLLGLGPSGQVFTPAGQPRAISWSSSTELGLLADSQSGVQVHHVAIDGSATTVGIDRSAAVLPDTGIDNLVMGPGDRTDQYATDRAGQLWFLPTGGVWQLVKTSKVTGLTYGG